MEALIIVLPIIIIIFFVFFCVIVCSIYNHRVNAVDDQTNDNQEENNQEKYYNKYVEQSSPKQIIKTAPNIVAVPSTSDTRGKVTAAMVFNIISIVLNGLWIFLIFITLVASISALGSASVVFFILLLIGSAPLCWSIPMTMHIHKYGQGQCNLSVGFKICNLLFVNTIAGIILLCINENAGTPATANDKVIKVQIDKSEDVAIDKFTELKKYKELLDAKIITTEEFISVKKKFLEN